jgi:signal transduction histidine kinase
VRHRSPRPVISKRHCSLIKTEDGTVRVLTRRNEEKEEFRITVEGTGSGIPPEVQKRLFEPFFTTKSSRGTGLGLALVRKVVEEHGGRVTVDTEPGKGTAFHIHLPLD